MFLDATKHNENVTDLANCKVNLKLSYVSRCYQT